MREVARALGLLFINLGNNDGDLNQDIREIPLSVYQNFSPKSFFMVLLVVQ